MSVDGWPKAGSISFSPTRQQKPERRRSAKLRHVDVRWGVDTAPLPGRFVHVFSVTSVAGAVRLANALFSHPRTTDVAVVRVYRGGATATHHKVKP